MVTTYDDIYTLFTSTTNVDKHSLPTTDEGIYELIDVGRKKFNSELFMNVKQDNATETLDVELTDSQILLFSHCMSYTIYKNMQSEFASMVSMSNKDNSLKDYSAQADNRRLLAEQEQKEISRLKIRLCGYVGDEV